MANLQMMLEKLNESEVGDFACAIRDDLECAESSENETDFRTNIAEAITNAQCLIKHLRDLQEAI